MLLPTPLPRNLAAALRDARHARVEVATSAVRDLGRIAQQSNGERSAALEAILGVLAADARGTVRAEAALALADARASEAVPRLLAALDDHELRVRQMALVALGELASPGDGAAVAAVQRALADPAPALRYQALIAFARLEPARRAVALDRALDDANHEVRYIALRLIEEALVDRNEAPAPETLARVVRALDDAESAVRLAAAILLGRSGHSEGHDVLALAAGRPGAFEPEDAQAAIELCGELRLEAARRGLQREAFGLLGWRSAAFGWHALVALARMGDARAEQAILRDLGAWTRETRTLAVAAAGRARLERARERLQRMRGDDRRADPDAVEEALALLGASG